MKNYSECALCLCLTALTLVSVVDSAKRKPAVTDQESTPPALSGFDWFASDNVPTVASKSKKKKKTESENTGDCSSYETSCTNCFCDSMCWMFDDCCSSYLTNASSAEVIGRGEVRRLAPDSYTCQSLPGFFDTTDQYNGPIYVITQCPDSFTAAYIRDGCRRGSTSSGSSSDQFFTIPVTSRTSGLVYRNMFCALCHNEQDTTFWRVSTQCMNSTDSTTGSAVARDDPENLPSLVQDQTFMEYCKLVYESPENKSPRRCTMAISTCVSNMFALPDDVAQCQRENGTLYVYAPNGAAYRNKHCAICNGFDVSNIQCTPNTLGLGNRRVEPSGNVMPFSILLDLNTGRGSINGRSNNQKLGTCDEGSVYDPFAAICRVFVCPTGQTLDDEGTCRRDHVESHSPEERQTPISVRTSESISDEMDTELRCPLIGLNVSEYHILGNGSVYVPMYDRHYDVSEYRFESEHSNTTVLICSPFSDRTYNDTDVAYDTLRLDVVGGYISLVCSIISLIGLSFQFLVYMLFPVLRNRPGQLVLCLIVSLFVGQLLFLLANKSSGWLCYCQAVVMHFFFLAAFLWMNVMAVDVYRTFGTPTVSTMLVTTATGSKRFIGYSLYAWGMTGLIVMVGVLLDQIEVGGEYRPDYGRYICWFGNRSGQMVFFALPLGVVLVANIALFIGSIVQIHRASQATRIAVQKPANFTLLMIYAKLSVVMGLGWMIGFLASFTGSNVLWYVFIVCNSLQGAFICLAFIVTRQVLHLMKEQYRNIVNPHGSGGSSGTSSGQRSTAKTITNISSSV